MITGHEFAGEIVEIGRNVEGLEIGQRLGEDVLITGAGPIGIMAAAICKGVYGRGIFETWYKMIAMLENGLDVSAIITHRFGVDDFEAGFAAMKSGQSGKVVLDWT